MRFSRVREKIFGGGYWGYLIGVWGVYEELRPVIQGGVVEVEEAVYAGCASLVVVGERVFRGHGLVQPVPEGGVPVGGDYVAFQDAVESRDSQLFVPQIVESGHDGLGDPDFIRHGVVVFQCRAWDGQLDYDLFWPGDVGFGEWVAAEETESGLLVQNHGPVGESVGLGESGVAQSGARIGF